MPSLLLAPVLNWARRLRFPRLLALTATLFVVTLVVPDPLPFVDELLLGLGALLFASWKQRRAPPPPAA
jgi:uncharacterized membrane protein YccC